MTTNGSSHPKPTPLGVAPGSKFEDSVPAFPPDFLFGFATASAQIESSPTEGGRGPSNWDRFCEQPGTIIDGSSVARTTDHYRLFREDIALMKKLGVNSYRFSFSWSRLIPKGGAEDPVSEKGIKFYNDLIDECLASGITPFATLYHWDLPAELDDRYGGWLSKDNIVPDFLNYARLCFSRFGDRVKHWLTFNEPWCVAVLGHGIGAFAPGHKSDTEPWIVGHSVILAHGYAARMYRKDFKPTQQGVIGITLNGDWAEPFSDTPEDIKAAQDKHDVAIGWFADPIYLGRYPQSMIDRLGERLPKFSEEEIKIVHGSSEFYGCNTYTTNLIKAGGDDEYQGCTTLTFVKPDGSGELGQQSHMDWLQDVPWGLRKLLNYLYDRYKTPIYMTENGWAIMNENDLTGEEAVHDASRVQYFQGQLAALRDAVVIDKIPVHSYFAWSMLDNFEWASGLQARFGCVHVDFETMKRTPKDSAFMIPKFFHDNAMLPQ
ncbi:glycoside hydrolase family 1 protein [Mrakia frigida]|uniref:glycoside hydrolase family 1 protein n=1 Tax=Mrakia frigida TaxID=29902 RepID=UPI003FCC2453